MGDLRCQYCNRHFIKKDHLIRHIRIHTKEKPFSCTTCRASFSRKDVLRRHERSHTKGHTAASRHADNNASGDGPPQSGGDVDAPRTSDVDSTLEDASENDPSVLGLWGSGDPPPGSRPDYVGVPMWDMATAAAFHNTFEDLSTDLFGSGSHGPSTDASKELGFGLGGWLPLTSTGLPRGNPLRMSTAGDAADTSTSGGAHPDARTGRRRRLAEAMGPAFITNWSMNDFKMSYGAFEKGTLARSREPDGCHELANTMVFKHTARPSVHFMNRCYHRYMESFWPSFPIVHLPSLAPSWDNNRILFYSMCLVGSAYIRNADARALSLKLADRVGFLILARWRSIMSGKSSLDQLILFLVCIHLSAYSLIMGDVGVLAACITHHGSTLLWARRAGITRMLSRVREPSASNLSPPDSPTLDIHSSWRNWIDAESKLRVAYALAIIDREFSSVLGHEPWLKTRPGCFQSPAFDTLFAAQTAEDWHASIYMASNPSDAGTGRHPTERHTINPHHSPRMTTNFQHEEHILNVILAIEDIAGAVVAHREDAADCGDIDPSETGFLQRLITCLPTTARKPGDSVEDGIRETVLGESTNDLPYGYTEARILWHTTLISVLVDINSLKRYHGADGVDEALSTDISLEPKTAVQLVLHSLVIRGLIHDYSVRRNHLPLFVQRCALTADMVLNWCRGQGPPVFEGQKNEPTAQGQGTAYPTSEGRSPAKLQFKDWVGRVDLEDPFTLLLRDGPSRERLQTMLDSDDSISSICSSLRRSDCANAISSSWMRSLEILENHEMDLVC